MEIRYERPLPDLSFLVRAPLKMDIGGGQVAWIEAWSPEGIRPPEDMTGDEGTVRLTIPFHGFDIGFITKLKRDPAANLMRFVDLGAREQRVLNHFYREIVTGRAVPIDRMITAMDTPVELVPMHQTPEEARETQSRHLPRALRAAAVLAFYGGLIALLYQPVLSPVWHQAQALTASAVQVAVPDRSGGGGQQEILLDIGHAVGPRPHALP